MGAAGAAETTNLNGDTGTAKTPPTLFESRVHDNDDDDDDDHEADSSLLPPPPPPPNTTPRRPPLPPLSSESPAILLDDDGGDEGHAPLYPNGNTDGADRHPAYNDHPDAIPHHNHPTTDQAPLLTRRQNNNNNQFFGACAPLSTDLSTSFLQTAYQVPNHSVCSSDCAARNTTDNPLTCYGVFQNSADGLMMCECLMMASCNALKVGASFGFKGCSPCQAETKVACGVYDGTTISTLAFFKIRTTATDGGNGATTATDGGAGGGGVAIATGDAGTTDSATSSTVTESEGSNRKNPVSIPTLTASPTTTGTGSLSIVPLSDASTSSTPTGTIGTLSTTSSSSSIPSSALIAIVVSLVAAVAITIGMAVVYSSRKNSGTLPVLRLGKSSPDDDMTPFRPKSTISPSSSLRSASVGGGASLRSLHVSSPPPVPLASLSYSSVPLSAGSQQQQQPQSWGWEGGFLGGPDPAAASFPPDSAAPEGRRSIDSTVSDATSVRMTTLVGYGHVYTALRPEVVTPPPMPVRPSSAVTGNSGNPATVTRRPSDASEDSFAVAGKPAAAVGRKLSAASETSSVAAKFVARAAAMPDFGGHSEPIS